MKSSARISAIVCLALGMTACAAEETTVAIQFAGLIGGEPAECGRMYTGIGTASTSWTLQDYRLYVNDVRLVTEDGREVPVTLEQDGEWQLEDIALLDFEGGGAGCPAGTAATNTTVRGTVADSGPFTGVRFSVGVPQARNHADVSAAPAPLDSTAMFWNWQGGYKFIRVDGRSEALGAGFFLHLGSTGCDGDPLMGGVTNCANPNHMEVALDGFDPLTDTVQMDAAAAFAGSDLEANAMAPGCMSGVMDPECGPVFERLGLPLAGAAAGAQQLFTVAP